MNERTRAREVELSLPAILWALALSLLISGGIYLSGGG